MTKYIFIILICGFCVACRQKPHTNSQQPPASSVSANVQPDSLITPGIGVGNIHLNDDAAAAVKRLGQPDKSDAAMGASLMVWYKGHDTTASQLGIYAHHHFGAPDEAISRIKQIRVTSPSFKTKNLVGTGMALSNIQKYFSLQKKRTMMGAAGQTEIYDDAKSGIAFEIDASWRCNAIIVHAPGDSSAAYINMQE